ncbi:MAG TPA: FecR domain-containing protein [Rhizomicrobium sp.]|nr:FecR domain-containing protein [Rhizomicrobium sp.]
MITSEKSPATIELEAAQWIERREFGGWCETDEAKLGEWLDQSLSHRVAYDRLDLGWQKAGRLTVLRQGQLRPAKKATAPTARPILPKFAVVAGIAAAAIAGWFELSSPAQVTYATSVGGREIVRLVDGSQIELNTNTAIRISDRRNRREVWLDRGEAYFEVTHDAAHPFVVNAGNVRLTDLGTKFSVRRNDDRLKVAVSEGGVRLETDSGPAKDRALDLAPGQVALATPSGVSIQREEKTELKNSLAWRSGVLIFHHTTLADAAAEFNRYNHRQIEVADPKIARLEIGGTFPTTDVEGFADVSRDVLHLRVVKDGDTIRISR